MTVRSFEQFSLNMLRCKAGALHHCTAIMPVVAILSLRKLCMRIIFDVVESGHFAVFEHSGGSRSNTKGEYVVLVCQHYLPT